MARKSESKDTDIIQILLDLDGEKYFLKIYFSNDKQSIIFKIEQDTIQTFYYSEKFNLQDFTKNFKKFKTLTNIKDIYSLLKTIIVTEKYYPEIKKDNSTITITFSKNSEIIGTFSLRKKYVSQIRLNQILAEKIQENQSKLDMINKSTEKNENNLKEQNDIIEEAKNKIGKINNNIENIFKDINNIKAELKETKNQKNIKKNNIEKKNDNSKKIKNNPKKKDENFFYILNIPLCKKQLIYELIFVLNVAIIIVLFYLLVKINQIEFKEVNEIGGKNDKKNNFMDAFENMNEYDLYYIQYSFENGNFLNYDFDEEEEKEEEENNNIEISEKNKNNNNYYGSNTKVNFKEIIRKSKRENMKKKLKQKNNKLKTK